MSQVNSLFNLTGTENQHALMVQEPIVLFRVQHL